MIPCNNVYHKCVIFCFAIAQAFEDMIRMVGVGFFLLMLEKHVMQLFLLQHVMVALCVSPACVIFSLHETNLLLCLVYFTVSLCNHCYKRIVTFSYRYWRKFLK
jgi:hypothetical protein